MSWLRIATCGACSALVVACGAKISERTVEDRWVGVGYSEAWRGSPYMDYSDARKGGDFTWRAPRWIPDAADGAGASGAGPATVWHLEVAVYPRISCKEGAGQWSEDPPDSRRATQPLPGSRSDLAALGKPERVERIWMTSVQRDAEVPIGGPVWMASLLRARSTGGTWLFPPSQNCRELTETIPLGLPARVIGLGDPIGEVRLNARSPFTVRVIDACPAVSEQRIRRLRSYHVPLVTPGSGMSVRVERTLVTARVRAECAKGPVSFEYGPFGGSQVMGDPRPRLATTGDTT